MTEAEIVKEIADSDPVQDSCCCRSCYDACSWCMAEDETITVKRHYETVWTHEPDCTWIQANQLVHGAQDEYVIKRGKYPEHHRLAVVTH